jgi:hypothetical protein
LSLHLLVHSAWIVWRPTLLTRGLTIARWNSSFQACYSLLIRHHLQVRANTGWLRNSRVIIRRLLLQCLSSPKRISLSPSPRTGSCSCHGIDATETLFAWSPTTITQSHTKTFYDRYHDLSWNVIATQCMCHTMYMI